MLVPRTLKPADPKLAFLRSLPGLTGTRDRELVELASLFDEARVGAGHVLMRGPLDPPGDSGWRAEVACDTHGANRKSSGSR